MNDPVANPEMLWHYTSDAGFRGIVESKTLWATDAGFLNDQEELKVAATAWASSYPASAAPLEAGEITVGNLHSLLTASWASKAQAPDGKYVASFTEDGDLLSQWRGYGRNGFSIGFRFSDLSQWAVDRGCSLGKVIYSAPKTAGPATTTLLIDPKAGKSYIDGPDIALYKNSGFREENEWRIVAGEEAGALKFRGGRFPIVPYIEIPIELAMIAEVRLGPGTRRDEDLRAVRRILGANGATQATHVSHSEVPYLP